MGSDQLPERSKSGPVLNQGRNSPPGEPGLPPFSAKWATGSRLAAIALTLVFVAAVLTARSFRQSRALIGSARRNTISTGTNERREVRLGDDAVATLGENSRVHYAVTLSRTEVDLVGFAEFKVVHSVTRVFDVRARNAHVVDLGTEFTIMARDDDSTVVVAVLDGSVALDDVRNGSKPEERSGRAMRIDAGHLVELSADGHTSPVAALSREQYRSLARSGNVEHGPAVR